MNTSENAFEARARVMKALASPVRLQIVEELRQGTRCLCELQPLFKMNKSTLSRHIAALKNVGIVREQRDGARIYYRLATPCIVNIFECVMNVIRTEIRRQTKLAKTGRRGAVRREERLEKFGCG